LEGPAKWLGDSVVSAIPADTRLQVSAVLIQDGVAIVDFDANAIGADTRQRRLLLAQLKTTLLQLSGVVDVQVSIASAPQDIDAAEISALPPANSFALTSEGIVRLSGSEAGLLVGSDQIVQDLSPRLLAVGAAGSLLAVANSTGVFRIVASDAGFEEIQVSPVGSVVDLEIDLFGNIWVFRDGAQNPIEVIDSLGSSQLINLPEAGRIISASVSPEGGRVAILATSGEERISIFGVVRNQEGIPLRLASSFDLESSANRVVSLTWSQPSIIRVLEKTAAGAGSIGDYPISGPRVTRTSPPTPGLVIETGFALIDGYMLSETGDVWLLSNNSWRRVQTGAADISTGR
jgi:hypothetical protein